MPFLETYQWLVETQNLPIGQIASAVGSSVMGGPGVGGGTFTCTAACKPIGAMPGCPASSFTAMGAAFATQGYFAQADLIWQLTNTNMGLWAPLLYILAAIGGLTSLAMGMPPKMYLWFFMGPAIYHFLLGTTLPTYGTAWCVANIGQRQEEVWKLAEVGLANSNLVARSKASSSWFAPAIQIYQYDQPSAPVEVSYLFLWFDALVSSTVQWMTVWTGVYQQRGGSGNTSGIIEAPEGTDFNSSDQYYLMSNLKWSMIDRIASARLHNGDIRDAFVTFMSSECGDALARVVNPGLLIAASNSKTGQLPASLFRGVTASNESSVGSSGGGTCAARNEIRDYSSVTQALASRIVPLPRSIRRSWWNPDRAAAGGPVGGTPDGLRGTLPGFYLGQTYVYNAAYPDLRLNSLWGALGSWWRGDRDGAYDQVFPTFSADADEAIHSYLGAEDNITCADMLFYVVNAFRWEAGNIYYQLASTAPRDMSDEHVVFNLFYGWDLRDECGEKLGGAKLRYFVTDLVLLHLIRNEMAMAPKVADSRFMQQGAAAGNAANRYIAETGGKAKYAEVYTWALMMPYVQGVLLYLLAMSYPFVCVMIVVPGWHKTLFTWMAFWTWVKLWDLGFAVVLVLERSIWAAMGNGSTAANLSQRIAEMQQWGTVNVSMCSREQGGTCPSVPEVVDGMQGTAQEAWNNLLAILDRSMLVGSTIDFDIQNGYYIYIMAALYFAVPAVTGQLVLGAKAGAAGMVSNLTQGAQSDGSRAAGQAFTGHLRNAAAANSASVGQGEMAKAFRNQGLAQQAIEAGNKGALQGMMQNAAGARGQGIGLLDTQNQLSAGNAKSNLSAGMAMANILQSDKRALAALGVGLAATTGAEVYTKGQTGTSATGMPLWPSRGGGGASGSAGPGGGAPGGAPRQGPGSPSGGGGSRSGNAPDFGGGAALELGAIGQFINHMPLDPHTKQAAKQAYMQGAQAFSDNALTVGYNNIGGGYNADRANQNVIGFGTGAASQGYGQLQNRAGAHANFAAESSAFEGRRDFANQTSGYLSALGVDSSVVSPGNKPTEMMGMAMSGMMGSQAAESAGYFNEGGAFFGAVGQQASDLNAAYGAGAVASAYSSGSVSGETANAWGRMANVMPAVSDDVKAMGGKIGKHIEGLEGKIERAVDEFKIPDAPKKP